MNHKALRAFTLVEVLVVLGIIAVLAGLAFPAYTSVKKKAAETQCIGRLRNIAAVVQLYRDSWNGTDAAGPSDQMGFPDDLYVASPLKQPWKDPIWVCRGRDPVSMESPATGGDLYAPAKGSPIYDPQREQEWIAYVNASGPTAVYYFDWGHQLQNPLSNYSLWRATGLSLDGSAKTRVRRNRPTSYAWWSN